MANLSNDAFQNAVQRARELAAKLTQQGQKRPIEESNGPEPGPGPGPMPKKAPVADPFGAQLAALKQQSSGGPTLKAGVAYLQGIVISGEKTLDMMIPGTKVGYIIGKGGEMIRNLQERAGVKMTVFQQTAEASDEEKQLRIVGEPDKVDYAKQLVNDLLTEKELESMKIRTKVNREPMTNDYGSTRSGAIEVAVPPQYIGLVIGKGGESIKRIQQESGTKIQFDTQKSDAKGNKICQIMGPPDASERAADMIREIIDNAGHGRNKGGKEGEEVRMSVPANRTGAVIGRGGETIRSIKQQSGCEIELEKNSKNATADEKIFVIRGPSERISYAQQLINDRVHGTATSPEQGQGHSGSNSYSGDQQQHHQQHHHQQQQQQQQQYWSNHWPSETSQSSNDSSSQDATAAWAAYYAQYNAHYAHQTQAGSTMGGGPGAPPNGAESGQTGDPAAGQTDYSVQWAEYYRAYGMYKEAEMIEQMAKKPGSNAGGIEEKGPDQEGKAPVGYPGYSYGGYGGNEKQ